MNPGLDALADEWREKAEDLRQYGADAQAQTLEAAADDLEERVAAIRLQTLTLREAAEESGYSYSRLQEMVGDELENVGEPGAPRVRRGDLPRKPGGTTVQVEETEDGVPDLARARLEAADS